MNFVIWFRGWRQRRQAAHRQQVAERLGTIVSEPLEPRIYLAGDIRFDAASGTLKFVGSTEADIALVRVVNESQLQATLNNSTTSQAKVFARSSVSRIEFHGYGGNDYFRNYLDIYSLAYGHGGADELFGGTANNHLYGGDGDDYLVGGPRNDGLYGGTGADRMFGMAGHDELRGDAGNDYLRGLDGNDLLQGDAGADIGVGDAGNDRVFGGDGNDTLRGMDGHDVVRGGAGADLLYGDDGVDHLYGEGGSDELRGGPGDDVLYGGDRIAVDRLYGEAGRDRFLVEPGDQLPDRNRYDGAARFETGDRAWNAAEIEVVDRGFATAFAETRNHALLRDSLDSDQTIVFKKYGQLNGGASSTSRLQTTTVNGVSTYRRQIDFRDWNEADAVTNTSIVAAVLHELAHSWDSSSEIASLLPTSGFLWTNFLARSGWRNTPPANPSLYNRSGDGAWWYLKSASFAREYGRHNPREDWGTTWEYYFDEYQRGVPTPANLTAKLQDLATLFYRLGSVS